MVHSQRVLVSLLLALTFSLAVKTCPRGWINFKDEKCFFISRTPSSHENANEYCLATNSNLALVSTTKDINSLKAIIRGNSIEKTARPTIASEVLEWIWISMDSNDSSLTSSSSKAVVIESNKVQKSDIGSLTEVNKKTEKVCWILSASVKEPRAVTCLHNEFPFICETPLYTKANDLVVPTSRVKRALKSCPIGWNEINTKCYKAIKSRSEKEVDVCSEKFTGSKRVPEVEMESIMKTIQGANINSDDNEKNKNSKRDDKDVKQKPTVSNPAPDDCSDSGQESSKASPCVMALCQTDLVDYNSNGSQLATGKELSDTQIRKLSSPDAASNHVNYGYKYKTMFAILVICALATMTLATGGVVMVIKKAVKEQRRRKSSLQFENILFDVDTVGKVEQEFTFHDLPNLA